MGGDDLGSDDERYFRFLGRLDPPRRGLGGAADGSRGGNRDGDRDSDSDDDHEARRPRHGGNKRRQRRQGEPVLSSSTASNDVSTKGPGGDSLSAEGVGGGIGGVGGAGHDDDSDEGRRLFRDAARLDEGSISRQASFVTRLCRCHYYRSSPSGPDDPDAGTTKTTTTEPDPVGATPPPPPPPFTFLPSHFVSHNDRGGGNGKRKRKRDNVADDETNYLDKLKRCISAKKLKNWRASSHSNSTSASQIASPCVIIVCSSARRAVTILKDLAPLKLPIAKLFPKNGSVSRQLELLASANNKKGGSSASPPPVLAVGTPHRLSQLARRSQSQFVQRTQLVVLDTFVSGHGATVGTAADTAPHCAAFLVESVAPQLQRRNDLRIAFL